MIYDSNNAYVDTINLYYDGIIGVGSLVFYDDSQKKYISHDSWLYNEASCSNGDDAFASGLSPSIRHVQPC